MGIEFLLELQAKLEGATQMVHALTKVEHSVDKTDHAMSRFEKNAHGELHHMGEWFKELGSSATSSFTDMLKAEAVWDTLKEGVHVIGEIVSELVNAAAEGERTELAFRNMLGPEEGERLLHNLDRFAGSTEFLPKQVKSMAQQLIDAGYAGESLSLAMSAVSDIAARSPNKMEGASAAVMGLSRAMLTGTLDARTLRMMKLSPKAVFGQMAADMGMGVKEVQKRLEAGKIKIQDVVNSLLKAIATKGGGVLGATGADMADSFGARLERFKNIPERLFEDTSKSPGLKLLGDSLERVTKMFAPGSPLGEAVVKGLAGGMEAFGNALAKIDAAKLSDTLITLFGKLPGLIEKTVTWTERLVSGIAFIYEHTLPGQIIKDKLFTAHRSEVPASELHDRAMSALGAPAGQVSGKDFISRSLFDKAGAGAKAGALDDAHRTGAEFGHALVEGASSPAGIDAHSPSKKFEELGRQSAEGYQRGLEMVPPSVGARAFMDGLTAPAAVGGGPITINAPVNVSVGGSEATPAEIAEAVRAEFSHGIVPLLEALGFAGGT